MAVSFLANDLKWLKSVTMKQHFCWGFVATCCSKVPISTDNLDWIHTYFYLVCQLGRIYSAYCKVNRVTESHQLLKEGIPDTIASSKHEDILKYFCWVQRVHVILVHWKDKFALKLVNYDDVLNYASHQQQCNHLSVAVSAWNSMVSTELIQQVKNALLENFEQLNMHLIYYIPGEPEARWCTLPQILVKYGISLPPTCVELISKHVIFPEEEKALTADILINHFPPSTSGLFQPGLDVYLKLTDAITLKILSELVEELSVFLTPLRDHLDMLIYFSLHKSEIFNKYMQLNLQKEGDLQARKRQDSVASASRSFLPSLLGLGSLVEAPSESGMTLRILIAALSRTKYLLLTLMAGTAKYKEIIAEGNLSLKTLDIDSEFNTLTGYSTSHLQSQTAGEGLAGIQSMLELFKYSEHIQTIYSVCQQYKLEGCLEDSTLLKLSELAEKLSSEHTRDEMTPLQAAGQLKEVKDALCLTSHAHSRSLDLFVSVANSAVFYQFVRDKKFVGEKGHARFRQQYHLITAQLQHEEYDETVLNHLYAAFHFIEPFMDVKQSFHRLMSRVMALDTTNGLKQLDTVNKNITLIRLWFNRAEVCCLMFHMYFPFSMCFTACHLFACSISQFLSSYIYALSNRVIPCRMLLVSWTAF